MGKRKEIPNGTKFGDLVVIGVGEDYIQPSNGNHHSTSICQCKCGNIKTIPNNDLRKGRIKSCGCMSNEYQRISHTKHGEKYTRLYHIWNSMKKRCLCSTSDNYEYYGGRGISLCDEWLDYIEFSKWAKSNGYKDNLTIDRINVDGNYCPENCRWVTMAEQNDNKTTTIYLTSNNETYTLSQWSKILNIPYSTLRRRYCFLGWSAEKTLTTPIDVSKRNHRYDKHLKEKKE